MNISQLMTRNVITCRADDRLNRAAQIMWEHDCGCVPVVDERGCVQGMITDRDICMAAFTQGRRLDEIPVASAMCTQVLTASPDDDVERVAALMSKRQVRRIPIVDEQNQVIGVLSLGDLARAITDRKANAIAVPTLAKTLSEISQPLAQA
jgi:CBS domain-containing protein